MSALRASLVLTGDYSDLTVGAILLRRSAPKLPGCKK